MALGNDGRITFDADSGALRWQGERVLVVPVEALAEIQRSAAESHGERYAADLLSGAGFAAGGRLVRRLAPPGSPTERAAACLATATGMGLGVLRLARCDETSSVLEVEVTASPFAAALAPATRPSCAYLSGLLIGIAQGLFGVGVAGEEIACAATGGDRCTLRTQAVAVADEGGWAW